MTQLTDASLSQIKSHQFAEQVQHLSLEEAQKLLIEMRQQVLHQESQYKVLLRQIAEGLESLSC